MTLPVGLVVVLVVGSGVLVLVEKIGPVVVAADDVREGVVDGSSLVAVVVVVLIQFSISIDF
jgi:hypothetical protein